MRSAGKVYPLEAGADARLVAFLDRLCEPLERTLSDEEIAAYRLQALGHLEAMVAELREYEMLSPGESVDRALREYGQPDLLAIGLLDERCKGQRPVGFARGARSASLWSFVYFGLGSALLISLDALAAMWPEAGSVAQLVGPLAYAIPVLAGYLTGRAVPTGNIRAALPALGILVLHASLAALLMQPFENAARIAVTQSIFAIPLGCASIYLTALLRRRPVRSGRQGVVA